MGINAGNISYFVGNGKTGCVMRRRDAMYMDNLVTLITDTPLCHHRRKARRTKAERELGLDRLITETLDVYRASGWGNA